MMIETEVMAEGWENIEEQEEEDDLFKDVYVETATGYLYEVQFFDTFCLVRIASPNVYGEIRKMSHVDFSGRFHEFTGDVDDLHDFLRGASPDFIIG
jgi:hypothetical protein